MTVGAVNGVYQYNSNAIFQMFSVSVSPDRINELMKKYGVMATGNEYTDLRALFQAMFNYFSRQIDNSLSNPSGQVAQQAASAVPWAPLMHAVGLKPTGNLYDDHNKFNVKINELEKTSYGNSDKEYYKGLKKEAPYVFVEPHQAPPAAPQASGAEIMAAMNRMLLVG